MIKYRELKYDEINVPLFEGFNRRQEVVKCRRWVDGRWVIKDDPFIDQWSEEDYNTLVCCLKNTVASGGIVLGAFLDNLLKGFASVEGEPIGSKGQYMDLSSIHVSEEMRGKGIGRQLFNLAEDFARSKGKNSDNSVKKLYISAHSAVETQCFYKAMGCVDAEEYYLPHVEKEPYDCQLEKVL